ncbi:hypothetical protein C8R44DRAFT_870676 [Mycena epipterygia]|nr:hypothetical protein C8R44DRAFT_870676 [Mycena epipterygia]
MPDAAVQTDQELIDRIEKGLKQEAIKYVQGRHEGAPSLEMMRWLNTHIATKDSSSVPPLPPPPPPMGMVMSAEEIVELAKMRKATVAHLDLSLQAIRDLEYDPHSFGPPPMRNKCRGCPDTNPLYRCLSCFYQEWYCRKCMVGQHLNLPFHRIEMWTGQRLAGISLKSIGLRIQLGHSRGDFCVEPIPVNDFVVVDATGIHEVDLDFCGCPDGGTRVQQLREARLYSKTCAQPTSAVAYEMAYAVPPQTESPPCIVPSSFEKKRKAHDQLDSMRAAPAPPLDAAPSPGRNPPPPLPPLDATPPLCPTMAALLSNPNLSTDGEAPERAWASLNPLATSTREMGPGVRTDTIDDHSTGWNNAECAWAAHWAPLLVTDDMPLMAARARIGDILHALQQGVLMRAHLRRMKDHGARGVLEHMRAADEIQACERRLERGTKTYQTALQALVELGQGDWGFPADWQALYFDRDAEPIAVLWEAATDIISTRYSQPGPLVDQLSNWMPSGPPVTTRPKIQLFSEFIADEEVPALEEVLEEID